MSKSIEHRIMTVTTDDATIKARMKDEGERVHRWVSKLIFKDENIIKTHFPKKIIYMPISSKGPCMAKPLGIIPWVSPVTGDTWASIILKESPYSRYSIDFYYWNTIGSCGFIQEMEIKWYDKLYRMNFMLTNHCAMRICERLNLDLSGVELMAYIVCMMNYAIPVRNEYRNKDAYDFVCSEGVLRTEAFDGAEIIRIKTFLSWKELGTRDYERLKNFKIMIDNSYETT